MLKHHAHSIAWIAGFIYFAQGALGVSGVALPLYLRAQAWSVTEVTMLMSIAAIPWIFKIFYGLLSDCLPLFSYRRKSYLILALLCGAGGWFMMVVLPPTKEWVLLALLIANTGFAATDVVTDGLVVEHSTTISSQVYQSIAWGSRSFGAMIGGISGGWLAAHTSPDFIFILTMSLPLIVIAAASRIHEKKMESSPFSSALTPFRRCGELLKTKNLQCFMGILLVASLSSSFGMPFFFFMKETLGFPEVFLGFLSSLAWFGAMIGSVVYLKFLRKVSPKRILSWAIILNCINILSALLIVSKVSAFVIVLVGGALGCLVMLPLMSTAAILTHHSQVESAIFAILMSIFNFGQIAAGMSGARLYSLVGLRPLILMAGLVGLLGILFVRRLDFIPSSTFPKPSTE
ncbi:MAG: MFS transporter [Candidatus Omnitrophica bacterium]|nr:MFS transporter [Candidatus Omnitrophota bacterium]